MVIYRVAFRIRFKQSLAESYGCSTRPNASTTCAYLRQIAWRLCERKRAGQYSIRINDQWRICFVWHEGQCDEVEIVDYH